MSIRTAILYVALGIGASVMPMAGNARVFVDIDVAPPAPQVEVVPEARVGFVWAPGYWNWDGHRHVWVAGRWIHDRPGHHWVPDRWDERHGRWHYEAGHWE